MDQFAAAKAKKCLLLDCCHSLYNATCGYKPTSLSLSLSVFTVREKIVCCECCMFFFHFHMLRGPPLLGWRGWVKKRKNGTHKCMVCYAGAWPGHHCKVADGALLNETIPKEEDGSYSKCKMYDASDRNKTIKCDQWKYFGDTGRTIVSEVAKHLCYNL